MYGDNTLYHANSFEPLVSHDYLLFCEKSDMKAFVRKWPLLNALLLPIGHVKSFVFLCSNKQMLTLAIKISGYFAIKNSARLLIDFKFS